MPKQKLECPVCEAEISVADGKLSRLRNSKTNQICPSCQQPFSLLDALAITQNLDEKPQKRSRFKLAPEALVKFDSIEFKNSNREIAGMLNPKPKPHEASPHQTDAIPAAGEPAMRRPETSRGLIDQVGCVEESVNSISQSQEHKISDPYYYQKLVERKNRQKLWFFVSSAALLLVTGILLIPVISSLQKEFSNAAVDPQAIGVDPIGLDMADASQDAAEIVGQEPLIDSTDHRALTSTKSAAETDLQGAHSAEGEADVIVQEPSVPPNFPKFLMFSRRQVDQIWKQSKPYIVSLEIHGPRGVLPAVGTIVDSRGWIATSHSAIKDAWKIEVSSVPEPANRHRRNESLRDVVRGIVVSDPDTDIAILAVNRRFVVSLAEVPIAGDDRLVQANRLVAVVPPNPNNYYGVSEITIAQRGESDKLPETIQRRLATLSGDVGDVNWMVVTSDREILPGTPLFDHQGELKGMASLTGHSQSLAVPVKHLPMLVSRGSDKLIPLKPPMIATEAGEVRIAMEHPAAGLQQRIQLTGTKCKELDFIPENSDDLQTLVEFLLSLQAGREFLKENKPDYRDSPENQAARLSLMQTADEFRKEIFNRFQQSIKEADPRLDRLNQLAGQQLSQRGEKMISFVGTVFPNISQLETVVLEVDNAGQYVTFPFDSTGTVMRPGSRWLFLVQRQADKPTTSFRTSSDKRIRANSVILFFEIGPFN